MDHRVKCSDPDEDSSEYQGASDPHDRLSRDGSVLGCTVPHALRDLQDLLSCTNPLDTGANSLQQRKLQAAFTWHLQFCNLCLPLSKSEASSHATVFNEQNFL